MKRTIVVRGEDSNLTEAERATIERRGRELTRKHETPMIFDPVLMIREEPEVEEIIKRLNLTPQKMEALKHKPSRTREENAVLTAAMLAGLRQRANHSREMSS